MEARDDRIASRAAARAALRRRPTRTENGWKLARGAPSAARFSAAAGRVSVANTSQSRACPRIPASHLISASSGARRSSATKCPTRPRHERSRRVPTRIWWIHSGSSSRMSPVAFAATWFRHSTAMARSASGAGRRPPAGQRPWLAPVGASRPGAPARAPARAPPCWPWPRQGAGRPSARRRARTAERCS